MRSVLTSLRFPAIVGLLLILPWMVLEVMNRWSLDERFPFPLFGILWLLPVVFILTIMPLVRNFRAKKGAAANPVSFWVRTALLVLLAWLWVGILIDQMPCFLGVPNCD